MLSESELKKLKEQLKITLTEIETKAETLSKEKEVLKSSAKNYDKTQELTKYIREKTSTYENILSNLIPIIEENIKKEQEAILNLKNQQKSVIDKKNTLKDLKNQRKQELYGKNFNNIPRKKEIDQELNNYKKEIKLCEEKLSPTADQSVTDEAIKLIKTMSAFGEKLDVANAIISDNKKESKSINYGKMNAIKENLDKELNELKTKYPELIESSTKKENFNYVQAFNLVLSFGIFILKILSTSSLNAIGTETTKKVLFPSSSE